MNNAHSRLARFFRKSQDFLQNRKIPYRIVFLATGLLATLWFLIRVIPKPSRAGYPCMRASAPLMSGFVLYLIGITGSAASFRKNLQYTVQSQPVMAWLFLFLAIGMAYFAASSNTFSGFASAPVLRKGIFPPNEPIGEAKGIFPGRVVWMWDPAATNSQCTNTSNENGYIGPGDDAWFMAANNNETVIDSMVIKCLQSLTGKKAMTAA
jgi:hypothetical protein